MDGSSRATEKLYTFTGYMSLGQVLGGNMKVKLTAKALGELVRSLRNREQSPPRPVILE